MSNKTPTLEKGGLIVAALLVLGALVVILWIQIISPLVATADYIATPLPLSVTKAPVITGIPVRLTIQGLGIDLPIRAGVYNPSTKTWTLDKQHVFTNTLTNDGTISNDPSKPPLLIYGHNFDNILGKTKHIKPNQALTIVTDNRQRLDYEFVRDSILQPTDSSILTYSGSEDLMVMTCSGNWDEKRRVMFFVLKKV